MRLRARGEAVVTLRTDRLDGSCAHARLPGDEFIQPAYALHARIGALGVYHSSLPDDVIYDDNTAQPR